LGAAPTRASETRDSMFASPFKACFRGATLRAWIDRLFPRIRGRRVPAQEERAITIFLVCPAAHSVLLWDVHVVLAAMCVSFSSSRTPLSPLWRRLLHFSSVCRLRVDPGGLRGLCSRAAPLSFVACPLTGLFRSAIEVAFCHPCGCVHQFCFLWLRL
jgi:hypothetical protein